MTVIDSITKKTVIEKVQTWAAKLAGARDAVTELHRADVELREAHAAAEAERVRLISAKPPKAEVLHELNLQIQKLTAGWEHAHAMSLVSALAGAVEVDAGGKILGVVRHVTLADEVGPITLAVLCAIAPELVRKGLTEIISAATWDAGPPMDERVALLAEVDRKILDIEEQHARLVDSAAEVGIKLQHMPNVVGRRTQAAQAHERWERDIAANRQFYKNHPAAQPSEPK